MNHNLLPCLFPLLVLAALVAVRVEACPYCTVDSATLNEEIEQSDAVVLARLVEPAAPIEEGPDELGQFGVVDPETGKARFKVIRFLKGGDLLPGTEEIEAVFFGEPDSDKTYMIRGLEGQGWDWNIPMAVSSEAIDYIEQMRKLPAEGPERMRFFLDYLQHEDPLLAQDSYDEFTRASYPTIIALEDDIDRERLWQWIQDSSISPSRRSLFFVLLGVTGNEQDEQKLLDMMLADGRVLRAAAEAASAASLGLGGALTLPIVPEMVAMDERKKQLGFNAMVGCYLKLAGSQGLDVLDEEFLLDPDEDPTKVYGVLLALRFLAEETDEVPMGRLKQSLRLVLDKPDFAEQAIRDLSRWEDWTVLDKLVEMFHDADPKTYVKEPIVAYLDQAAKQPGKVGTQARKALAEIEQAEPETVKRARSLMAFGFLGLARPGSRAPDDAPPLNDPNDPSDEPSSLDQADAAVATDELEQTQSQVSQSQVTHAESDSPDAASGPASEQAVAAVPPAEVDQAGPDQPAAASQMAEGDPSGSPAAASPDPWLVRSIPLVAAAVFAGLVWLVLRGGA